MHRFTRISTVASLAVSVARQHWWLVAIVGAAAACDMGGSGRSPGGGNVQPGEVRADDAGDGSAADTDGGDGTDASGGDDSSFVYTTDATDGALMCWASGGGGGSGSSCDVNDSWTCSDGTSPEAHCTCPAATCDCSYGSTTRKGVPFRGCPMCPSTDQAADICGIPH